jgi:hypothetical protein
MTVNGTEVAVLIRPFVPDGDFVVLKIFDVGVALQEPQQLIASGRDIAAWKPL